MNDLLGRRIRTLREERNITQEQMAAELQMSRQKYARIEKGMNDITLEVLLRIASIFQVGVNTITQVLDGGTAIEYRAGENECGSAQMIYDMLDLVYANKHVYDRIHASDEEMG